MAQKVHTFRIIRTVLPKNQFYLYLRPIQKFILIIIATLSLVIK